MKDIQEITNELLKTAIERKLEAWIPNLPMMVYVKLMNKYGSGVFSATAGVGKEGNSVALSIEYTLPNKKVISGFLEVRESKNHNVYMGHITMNEKKTPLGVYGSLSNLVSDAVDVMYGRPEGSAFDGLDYFKESVEERTEKMAYKCDVVFDSVIGDKDRLYVGFTIKGRESKIVGDIMITRMETYWSCRLRYDDEKELMAFGKDEDLSKAIDEACESKPTRM